MQEARRRRRSRTCSGGFRSKNVTSASTRGLEELEAEAEAAEADDVVFVGGGKAGNSERGQLRTLQIVVEEVVVLEASLGVPLAVARRHPIQCQLAGQTGREYADIVGAAERGAAERGATRSIPVLRGANRDPGRRGDHQ